MDFNIIADIPQALADMAVEIRLALGLPPLNSHLALYRRFSMPEFSDELDLRLIELFKGYGPMRVQTDGYLKWHETNGFLFYRVEVPAEFNELRQHLTQILPGETVAGLHEYFPHITLGSIPNPGYYQRDLIDRLFFPATWTIERFQLESEVSPGKWVLEAAYNLIENSGEKSI